MEEDRIPPVDSTVNRSRRGGFALVLIATAIAGLAGFASTSLVAGVIGPSRYAVFAIFWSTLYLLVGALSGVQQEVTRGTFRTPFSPTRISRARNFAIIGAATVFVVVVASAALWVGSVFPVDEWALVWPVAVGAASYVGVATFAGSLFGIGEWVPLAFLIGVDGVMRFAALAIALTFTRDIPTLAWAVAIPLPATLLVIWPIFRKKLVGLSDLDVGYRRLTSNVMSTVAAATATATLISGFPLVLGVTSMSSTSEALSVLILAITLTRAPVVITAMSLQGYFIVRFRERPAAAWRTLAIGLSAIGILAIALALLGGLVGPAVFLAMFGDGYRVDGPVIAALIASSALVGGLCITGPAELAANRHGAYAAGWIVGALATVAMLLLPAELVPRVMLALLVGPSIGLIVHLVDLALMTQRTRRLSSSNPV